MDSPKLTELLATYVHAVHILHHHGVLDGFGHLSVRNPEDPATFFMMYQKAPVLVSGLDDIGLYYVSDADSVLENTRAPPVERFIHSEIYKRFPDVNVVLHGHPEELIPYSNSDLSLRVAVYMAGFLGHRVSKFDITKYYLPDDPQDFLVRNQRLGEGLAKTFDANGYLVDSERRHNLVLMRNHGFTSIAADIKTATYQGIYALVNARAQSETIKVRQAYGGAELTLATKITYLNPQQIAESWQAERELVEIPWAGWLREVKVNPLYVNRLDPDRGAD
ncbi:class II aldolase and Adducin N-terminal domain-containing protein [Chaetomium strumarium]|uniref:Class II aldolase and Adducin N-terminal domain-containing protein n=1 Tax=Chaetomium strumarium TaxID=1170767 RepID=A0AAJ0M144_9PEZI|nr:class II aldolase and Adducin N-terminal domain-containing protein [Chaetomium strumarium]